MSAFVADYAKVPSGFVDSSSQHQVTRMNTLTRHHVTAFVDPAVSEPVEELRRRWDPQMARQIGAHVTVIYPKRSPTRPACWRRRRRQQQPRRPLS
jgi:hypothetical protein